MDGWIISIGYSSTPRIGFENVRILRDIRLGQTDIIFHPTSDAKRLIYKTHVVQVHV
jgi:hypothetical protein